MAMTPKETAEQAREPINIQGLVVPVDWDEEDNVIAVAIATDQEEEYFVNPTPEGEELIDYVDEKVEVTGFVTEDEEGNKEIEVTQFWSLDQSVEEGEEV